MFVNSMLQKEKAKMNEEEKNQAIENENQAILMAELAAVAAKDQEEHEVVVMEADPWTKPINWFIEQKVKKQGK